MNTPTPAQALGEVIALSARERELTGDDWLEAYRAFTDASRNLVNQHGQHFAGLEKRFADQQRELFRLQGQLAVTDVLVTEMRNRADAAESRAREAEGLLREVKPALAFHDANHRIAAFLAARG